MANKHPLLGPVQLDGVSITGDPQFLQTVEEITVSNGKQLDPGDLWVDGTLRADGLLIAWAERIADIPQFVLQIERQTGRAISLIKGTPSVASPGEPPLLGDWIAHGSFDENRFGATLARELGGVWEVGVGQNEIVFRRLP
jgi:hypothetical protein